MTTDSGEFHPDLRVLAARLPRSPMHPRALVAMRALTRWKFRKTPADVELLTLPSGVGIRLFRPATAVDGGPALLWVHGGGYVMGTAAQDDALCRALARELGILVASVEYRLAPEHPYPAAVDDCAESLMWLAGLPAVDPRRIAIGGASAGAGLVAMLALHARDTLDVAPVFQLLTFPMLDDRTTAHSAEHARRLRLWNEADNRFAWTAYLGGADPEVAVPGRRADLEGLPPAWIGVGTNDLFYAEDLAYADRLRAAGVPCQIDVVQGAFHGFDTVAPKSGVARSFFGTRASALRDALDLSPPHKIDPSLVSQPTRSPR